MLPRNSILLLFLFLCLGKAIPAFSQSPYNPKCRYYGLGVSLKTAYFRGDIPSDIRFCRPGFGVHFVRRYSPRWTFMAELSVVRIMGDDNSLSNKTNPAQRAEYIRNLSFRNDIKQLDLVFQYDLFPNLDHYRKRPIYNVYIFTGLSFFHHNPMARDSTGKWIALRPLMTEGVKYSAYQVGLPLGVGIRYKLGIQWDLEVEFAYKLTMTDYLDDVSGRYADPSTLSAQAAYMSNQSANPHASLNGAPRDLNYIQNTLDDPITKASPNYKYVKGSGPGDRRGTRTGFDSYAVISFRLTYIIPPARVSCPRY